MFTFTFYPSLINLMVSVDVKHHVYVMWYFGVTCVLVSEH